MKYYVPFRRSKIVRMSPRPQLSATKSLVSTRQPMHSRRVPSFFFTYKNLPCTMEILKHGLFLGLATSGYLL